jgi:hypothetical protein
MIGPNFLLAGRAIFTLSVPAAFTAAHPNCKDRYTFKVVHKAASDKWPEAWFVNLLSGPDNISDYQPLGKLNPETGAVRLVRSTTMTDESWPVKLVRRVMARAFADQLDAVAEAGFELRHEGRCGRCGRVLTVPESIDTGLGATCAAKVGATWAKHS